MFVSPATAILAFLGLNAEWSVCLAIVVGGLLVVGGADVIRFSLKRVMAIASVCFRQSIRRRVLWITPLVMLGVIIVSQFQRGDPQDAIRQTITSCLFASGLLVLLVMIVLASTNLPKEIENRVIYTVATKPATRLEIVLGKVIGFACVSFWMLLIMGVFTLGFLNLREWQLRQAIAADLEAGAVDEISRSTLQYYQQAGLLHARQMSRPARIDLLAHRPRGADDLWVPGGGNGLIVAEFAITADQVPAGSQVEVEIDVRAKRIYMPPVADTQPSDGPAAMLPSPPRVGFELLDEQNMAVVNMFQVGQPQPIELPEVGGVVRRRIEPQFLELWLPRAENPRPVYVSLIGGGPQHAYGLGRGGFHLIVDGRRIAPVGPPRYAGRSGRFGEQLRGGSGGEAGVALFQFRDQPVPAEAEQVTFELRVGLEPERDETDPDAEVATRIVLEIVNRSNDQAATVELYPESNRSSFIQVPAGVVRGGDFDVWLRMAADGYVGLRTRGYPPLMLVRASQNFAFNLLKSLSVLWMLSILITIIGLCASTFLSWPIAIVLTVMVLIGRWATDQIGVSDTGRSFVADFLGAESGAQARAISETIDRLGEVMTTAARFMPDISRFGAIAELQSGLAVSSQTLLEALGVTVLFGAPALVLAYVFLKYKEVAP
mgnify:CR=1 FL=1